MSMDLKEELSHFIHSIRKIRQEDWDDEAVERATKSQYQHLRASYQNLTSVEINAYFSSEEIKAIHVLELGFDSDDAFKDIVSKMFKTQDPSRAIALWVKSRQGFEFINNSKRWTQHKSEEEIQSLQDLFGGVLGVEISKECVRSIKAEQVSSIIGYALSGLQEVHEKEYREINNPSLTWAEYLTKKVFESDVEAKYTFVKDKKEVVTSFSVDLGADRFQSMNGLRKSRTADSCVVCPPRGNKPGKIVIGSATTNMDVSRQKVSFFKIYQAAKAATKNKNHEFYGYAVEPFYYLSGLFPTDMERDQQQEVGRQFFKMFDCSESGLNKEEKTTLAQLPFLRLLANESIQDLAETLMGHNVFMAGCDTMKWHELRARLMKMDSSEEKGAAIRSAVMMHLTDTAKIMKRGNLKTDISGGRLVSYVMESIQAISEGLLHNVNTAPTSEEYQNCIKPFHEEALVLVEHFLNNPDVMTGKVLGFNLKNHLGIFSSEETWNAYLSGVSSVSQHITIKDEGDVSQRGTPSEAKRLKNVVQKASESLGWEGRKCINPILGLLDVIDQKPFKNRESLINEKEKQLKGFDGKFSHFKSIIENKKIAWALSDKKDKIGSLDDLLHALHEITPMLSVKQFKSNLNHR